MIVLKEQQSQQQEGQEVPSRMQYPLSRDERAAMARYISGLRRQLQDVSDLFTTRYGKNSYIAEIAVKTLVSSTLLEHEMLLMENAPLSAETEEETVSRTAAA